MLLRLSKYSNVISTTLHPNIRLKTLFDTLRDLISKYNSRTNIRLIKQKAIININKVIRLKIALPNF